MNRLTQRDEQGNWCLKGLPWKQLHVGNPITRETYELIYAALWKLKEYEDTGLTPEEILDGKMLNGWIPVAEQLPKPGNEVLAYIRHNYAEDGWRAYRVYEYTDHWVGMGNLCDVIAWMPLPEPYRPEMLREAGADAGQYADTPTLQSAT